MSDAQPTVVFDRDGVVVLAKPAGLPTVPYRLGEREHCLRAWAERELAAPMFVVHRLDKETSGLVTFARDAATHRRLSQAFEHRKVTKIYLAAVLGSLAEVAGTVDAPLREFGSGRIAVDPRGKPSRTRYQVCERLVGADLLRVELLTGRRHQIRVHLFHLGHPILGDPLYGTPRPVGGASRLLLHAHELTLPSEHGPALHFVQAAPDDFAAALAPWRTA